MEKKRRPSGCDICGSTKSLYSDEKLNLALCDDCLNHTIRILEVCVVEPRTLNGLYRKLHDEWNTSTE